jgi:hypothetical protein
MNGTALVSLTLSIILLGVGMVATILMFEVLGRHGANPSFRLIHRWLGRSFVFIFLIFLIYMLPRAAYFASLPIYEMLHALLGLALFPLVVAKVLVVRRYKSFMGSLPTLGFVILLDTFLIIMLSSGYFLIRSMFK